ncbi:lipid A biosynthesis acyltransferase [Bacteroidia bacterium]|nr:lipid A biosynthesis acyltransferase [Bacteroidia bacterium]
MSVKKNKKWDGVTGGGTLGQRALLFLFHWHNVTVGYVILALVVPFYMLFARQGYRAIYRYFRAQWGYLPWQALCKTYRNHFVFGQCMLDRFAVYAGRRNFFEIKITGNEHFLDLLDGKKGFVMASSHVGNFELSGYLLRQNKKRINAMVFGGETKEVMEQRLRTLNLNNVVVFPVSADMSHIFAINNALQSGEIVSMPCDRNFGSSKSTTCNFLRGQAEFPLGAFALAAHFDVPVLTIFVMKETFSRYHIYVKPLQTGNAENLSKPKKTQQLAAAYAKELENIVKKYPEQWFNFYEFWK